MVTDARCSLSWKQSECQDVNSTEGHVPFFNDGPTYLQAEPEKDNLKWSPIYPPAGFGLGISFLPSTGRDIAREGGREDTQAGFAATVTNTSAALLTGFRSSPGVIWAFLLLLQTYLSVSLTNTCRVLIKLNLALFSSNSLTKNQFKKG